MIRALGFASIWLCMTAYAQDHPSFDCRAATSTVERLVCEDAELARLDQSLAQRYASARRAARSLSVDAARAEAALRATQRGWIKGRDECWKAAEVGDCVRRAYLQREGELIARWMLEPPTGSSSWLCGDDRAKEVVTYFFETHPGSVRIERGDDVDVGSRVPTASGARYEGSFGRSIWIKGEEALYREADPAGISYRCLINHDA